MSKPKPIPRPVILAILDGWGDAEGKHAEHDTFFKAHTPNLNALSERFNHSLLDASEHAVGLPEGQMGNSEVGHMNIGAGRVVMQDLPRIDKAVADGSLAAHPALRKMIEDLKNPLLPCGGGMGWGGPDGAQPASPPHLNPPPQGGRKIEDAATKTKDRQKPKDLRKPRACHILGLLSPGGVHAHQDHIAALANIVAAEGVPVWIHAFLDGRDTPPKSALEYLEDFENTIRPIPFPYRGEKSLFVLPPRGTKGGCLQSRQLPEWLGGRGALSGDESSTPPPLTPPARGGEFNASPPPTSPLREEEDIRPGKIRIATVGGRYFAMDRDKRWDRVQQAYRTLMDGQWQYEEGHPLPSGRSFPSAQDALLSAYSEEITDEFIKPAVIDGYQASENYPGMQDGDALICANFRADRARQILTALLDPAFDGFARKRIVKFSHAIGMVEYSEALNPFMETLFPPESLHDTLGEVVAKAGRKQLRIAETEKYAHVTFFFNGGREEMFEGEERILVPSPKVATYDLQPEMSADEVTDKLIAEIESEKFDLITVNYANADMVGHSGDMQAAIKAVETVDHCVGRLFEAVEKAGGALVLSADHGNIEQMFDEESDQPHTAHTLNRVPFAIYAAGFEKPLQPKDGRLADIAPTVLKLLRLPQPRAMTGKALFE